MKVIRICHTICNLPAKLLVVFVAAIAFTACSTTAPYPPAPTKVDPPNLSYKIAAMDALNIVVWRNPELSTTVTVRPDGYISTPLVEDIQAAGRSPADLSREIEKALSKYIRDPVVSVVVTGFQGGYSDQVRIVGDVGKPLAIPYRENMTVLDIVIQAGGPTEFANPNGAVIIRGSEGGKRYSVRLNDLIRGGDASANVPLMPGDIVVIPRSLF